MSAVTLEAVPTIAPPPPKSRRGPLIRALIVLGIAAAVAIGGVTWLHAARPAEATDNAYLKADSTTVAPRVKGLIATVLVTDNQAVKAGDPLVQLDPEEYAARLAAAEGDLALANAAVAQAEAALNRLGAEQGLAAAGVAQSRTRIAAADAEARRAEADARRFQALVAAGTVPRRDAERVQTEAIAARANADNVRAALAVSQSQAGVTTQRRGELEAALAAAQAGRAKAAAALDLARQDQAHTLIRAPIDGVVGDLQARPGDYVQPGSRLLTIAPVAQVYVTANFKETQTGRMLTGQRAEVRVDALPGVKLTGRVQSIAPGTGSEFALLPFEPGTGNFTKIVQRVPVRIVFDPGQTSVARLRPGLSAKVKVALK